ncbi:MAG TPA: rhodanese-like domain-containing protein [Rubrivivax sp.]
MTHFLPSVVRGLAALSLMLASAAAVAAEIVDAAYVEAALARGAVVWDVRDAASYKDGHIPGAVNAGELGAVLRDPNREDWLPTSQVQAVLGKAGIDPLQREVIAYSRLGDPNAYHAQAGLRYFGARSAKVFHGGLDAWQAAGKPVAKEATVLPPVALTLAPPAASEVLWTPAMIERIKARGTQIVDTRTPKEFAGEDVRAIRGGHIPGAINMPFEDNWVDPQTGTKLASKQVNTRAGMSLKPTEELQKLYAGLDREREVVVYCQSGVRASVTASVLRDLGFKDVKLYEPSWLGYAGTLSAPAEREVFFNVAALNGRLAALQGRVGELEAELTRVKAAR